MRRSSLKRAGIAFVAVAIAFSTVPLASAGHEYEQPVWFNHNSTQLDVQVVAIQDPVIGAIVRDAMESWEKGLADLDPNGLGADIELRTHWPSDGAPPSDFEPDIYFVPQGFYAIQTYESFVPDACIANAPMPAWLGLEVYGMQGYRVALHEFGHCLGLGHVFEHGNEYEPEFDPMGNGHDFACPSNLNLQVLERVFSGQQGEVTISSSNYEQSTCPKPDTVV